MAKSKKTKVEEAVEEIKEDLTASYHEMCSELGKKATVFQRQSIFVMLSELSGS